MAEKYNPNKEKPIATFFLHLIMIEFLFFSGEVYYTSTVFGGGGKIKVFFVVTCFGYAIVSNSKLKIDRSNLSKVLFIIFWVLLCTYPLGQGEHGLQCLDYIQFSIGMFFVMSSTDFYKFRDLILKYLIGLSIISIIVQIGHDYLGIFPAKTYIDARGEPRSLSLGLFTTEWGENRLSSIFWEPGQYQIVIYYVLILFADEWSDITQIKKSLVKFGGMIVALIMTLSTTAYLILGLVVLSIIVRSGLAYVKYIPLLLLLGGFALYSLFISEAVQKKIEQSKNDSQESSYTIRLADNIACLMVTLEDPLTGFGPGSDKMEDKLFSQGSASNSNGWLYGSAQLGIPYIIFLWVCMLKNLKLNCPRSNRFILFLILLLSQANESVIYFPYIYIYIFKFNKTSSICYENRKK